MPLVNQYDRSSEIASGAYGVSAGLDVLSGVFGFLAAQSEASMAQSRADMARMEAEANAQRYAEQAAQSIAHEKVMYLVSGVTLAGSPVAALATSALNAQQNVEAIRMEGETAAMNEETTASNDAASGRTALIGGLDKSVGMGIDSYVAAHGGGKSNADLGVIASLFGGGKP